MIFAVFDDCECTKRVSGLTQWDYGQDLKIQGISGLKNTEVHFAADGSSTALIQMAAVSEDGTLTVRIPDELLEYGRTIRAYVYVTDADSGETVRTVEMPVTRRPKPEDYTAPAERNLLRQVLEALNLKADDMGLTDGELYLLANGKQIGKRIRLPTAGTGGKEIELRNNGTAIQWRYTDSNEWTDLVNLEDLRGPAGETPEFEVREGHLYAIYQN